jgi:sugar lactone lactonase YvrE
MSYPSSKRRLRPARGVAVLVAALMAGGAGLGALTSPAQAAVLPTSGQTGTVQTMIGNMQNYAQFGACTVSACPGDGGPSTSAQLYNPRALAFDPITGDIYVADALNERIRKVDIASGNISTFAGTGAADSGGVTQNGYVANAPGNPGAANGDGGPATSALFNQPHGVAVDSHHNVYVSDSNANKIRKIDAATGQITTIAGNGDPRKKACPSSLPCNAVDSGVKFPKSMFMAPGDKLYVADSGNNMVRMLDLNANPITITTIAGTSQSSNYNGNGINGRANSAQLNQPEGVAVDTSGNVYIADSGNNLVRKVDPSGIMTTLAGDTALAQQHAADPTTAPAWDSDSAGDGGAANLAHLDGPRGIAVDSAGNIYIGQESGTDKVADTTGSRIRKIDAATGVIQTIAGDGRTNGRGQVPGDPGPSAAGAVEFNTMHDLTMDSHNNLWIADSKNNLVRVLWDAPHTVTTTIVETPPTTAPPGGSNPVPVPGKSGYWMLGEDGKVFAFGDARSATFGDASGQIPSGAKAVHIEPTPSGKGYWINDDKGGVYAFGDAAKLGGVDASALQNNEKVTSLSTTPSGAGYWLFSSKGRVFAKGDAGSFGDLAGKNLNGAIQSSIPTPSGKGYYMVGSDGGVFAFGDAAFWGSMGNVKLNKPVLSLVPTRTNKGYWLVASDGGIFAFGDAPFIGSMGSTKLNKPVVGMVRFGNGYLMVGGDGGIFAFSDKQFAGSLGDNPPARPIVFAATLDS